MSAWADVLADVAARGGTPAQVAQRLGLARGLVDAVLGHAERLGLVVVAGGGCGSGSACPTTAVVAPPGCAGCPLRPNTLRPNTLRPNAVRARTGIPSPVR